MVTNGIQLCLCFRIVWLWLFTDTIVFQFVWLSLRIHLPHEASPEPWPATGWNGAGNTSQSTLLRNSFQFSVNMTQTEAFYPLKHSSLHLLCILKNRALNKSDIWESLIAHITLIKESWHFKPPASLSSFGRKEFSQPFFWWYTSLVLVETQLFDFA